MIHPKDLASLLRDRSRWPEGFEWDFYNCNRCAMGLAQAIWRPEKLSTPSVASTAALLGIKADDAARIFAARPNSGYVNSFIGDDTRLPVEPEDIAADLEAL